MSCSNNNAGSIGNRIFCVYLPGVDDVTDGSVDYYPMDWEMSDTVVPECEMENGCSSGRSCSSRCSNSCGTSGSCPENTPEQTDQQDYEIVTE